MGNYAQLWLDDFYVGSSINDFDADLISLFRAEDKIVRGSPLTYLPIHLEQYRDDLNEDPELKAVYYEAPIDVVRDRLDVLGYDLVTAQEAFKSWVQEAQNSTIGMVKKMGEKDTKYRSYMADYYQEKIDILSLLTPESWMEGLKNIRAKGLKTSLHGRYEGPEEDPVIRYMLSNDWYGFPGYDQFIPLRLAIEACENGENIIYDLTDFVWSSGNFTYDEDFVEYGIGISSEYNSKSKTIVLTEGKTDARILAESLSFLYPHLKDYFSFLDFDGTSFGGGVGNLANVVKAFAGAGIVNDVIALFDNDTAAASACKGLENITKPPNIAIKHLPELNFLKNYPTIGPTGNVSMNVNGIAASIELYLGEDVLRIDGKNLVPIQWTGYDKLMKKYQGEVLEKAQLQARFTNKLARAREGEELDWDGIRTIFHILFTAFLDRNRKIICKWASDSYAI